MTSPAPDLDTVRQQISMLVKAGDTRQLRALRDQVKSAVDRQQVGARAAKYGADPVRWVEERLGQTVWSKQAEILHSLRDNRRTAVRSCHGIGKSHSASLAVCHWLDTHPPGEAFVVSTAPTFAQVRAILWRYIRRNHKRSALPGRVNQTEWHIDDELVAFGRKPADHDESAFQGIHCMSMEHEILTRRGWLGAEEITEDDQVLSVPVDGEIAEWMPVTKVHRYDFDGELNVYEGRTVSFAYTDEHRLPVKGQGRGPFALRKLADIQDAYQVSLRRTSAWEGSSFDVPAPFSALGWDERRFAEFVGFWAGDGGLREHHATGRFYEVLLYQRKGHGLPFLDQLIEGLRTFKGRDYIGFSNRAVAEWLRDNVGRYQTERRIPDQILNAQPGILHAFCDGLWAAEGSHRSDGRRGIMYTTSRVLADQVQEILIKLGRPASLSINRQAGQECALPQGGTTECRETYCLSWVKQGTDHTVYTSRIAREPYSGQVWCISTPHETFYTRRRGKVSLSGNSRYVLVVLDEACGIPEQLWIAADALTTNNDCRMLAIGNPDNPSTHFRKVCAPGSGWHVLGISAFDSPNLTGEPVPEEVAQALVSREWVEEKAREWGEDNPLYKSKVLGEFPEDASDQVVRTSDIAACRINPETQTRHADLEPVELGVDVGGGGDETVIRERRGPRAGREWRAHTDRPEQIAPLILRAIAESGATAVKIDSIGIGFGVIGELRNLADQGKHKASIRAVNVAEKASRPDKFLNLRAELWWEVGRGLSERKGWDLSVMDNADATVAQLLEPRWDVDPQGRIRVEPKDEIRKRLGRSPDNADALLLAFYAAGQTRVRWL